MSDLTRAAQVLRDSVGCLPEHLRQPWERLGGLERLTIGVPLSWGAYHPVAHCDTGAEDGPHQVADHIATTASPEVVAGVADLLAAIPAWSAVATSASPIEDYQDAVRDLRDAAESLAAAILRTEEADRA